MLERSTKQVEDDLTAKIFTLSGETERRKIAIRSLQVAIGGSWPASSIASRIDRLCAINAQVAILDADILALKSELGWVTQTKHIAANRQGAS